MASRPTMWDGHSRTLDMGTDSSYGGNDIFGNITRDIYANNTSGMITASGNYWGS